MAFRDYYWKSTRDATRVLHLSWTLFDGNPSRLPPIVIECQEYVPRMRDVTKAKWQQNGRLTEVPLPTYACKDTDKLVKIVGQFLAAARDAIEADLINQTTDELERLTLGEAYRYARKYKSDTLIRALRLRANTILSAGSGTPRGDETLGIDCVANAAAGYVGERPLPPAIDHQIDVAMWEIIRDDHHTLLGQIKKKLYQNKGRRPWLELFLTFFIALANVQDIHGQAVGWMRSQQQTDAAVHVSYLAKQMIEHWNYSANNILHHFRSIFRGELPLKVAERNITELVEREQLDSESTEYVQRVLGVLQKQDDSLLTVADESFVRPLTGEVTEMGDHWIRKLFADQYHTPD
ncbi:hypothetical protein OEA41_000497 [Lepraria neglecta]|uniref:Uncharacterized protein n=1 Tax=Lepraria neglecta TaxID=209136 RepID=A0AAE0DPV4_9LECA|nr:hypothetical protein OEA41_000497 [Lepraria neglecta]